MSFYNKMNETVNNVSVTENGMVGYKTTYHPLLDMNFKIASYRSKSDLEVVKDFKAILESSDAEYALRFIFMVRDAREGLGERRLFRLCVKELLNHNFENKEEIFHTIIKDLIPQYGRYDDMFVFMDTDYEDFVVDTVRVQLLNDHVNAKRGKSISLLAKWMPSENASSKETKRLARKFISALNATPASYRQMLSGLRAYSKVIETQTSANEWATIDYSAVPSKANLKYKDAFLRHDEQRRRDFLAALRNPEVAKAQNLHINSGVNYPHEIVSKYSTSNWGGHVSAYDEALEQLWKALKPTAGLANTIVVRDGSGSMTNCIGGTKTTALDVSTALAIYCSEQMEGDFKDKFITFSRNAKLIDLSKYESLHSKLEKCYKEDDCSNTNLENVFNLILQTAVDHKMNADEIPAQVLVISDMEFDPAGSGQYGWYSGFNCDSNVINNAAAKFARYGYKLPKLVFWNVASRTNTIPCKYNENGVLLVSGFSVNILKMVLNGKTDPFEAVVEELGKERYNSIPLLQMRKVELKFPNHQVIRNAKTRRTLETPSFLNNK